MKIFCCVEKACILASRQGLEEQREEILDVSKAFWCHVESVLEGLRDILDSSWTQKCAQGPSDFKYCGNHPPDQEGECGSDALRTHYENARRLNNVSLAACWNSLGWPASKATD